MPSVWHTRAFLRQVVVMLPTCLSILAFAFKLRYPLRTTEDIMKVKAAIGRHKLAVDWETAARAEGSPFRTDPATQVNSHISGLHSWKAISE